MTVSPASLYLVARRLRQIGVERHEPSGEEGGSIRSEAPA
jgi:hypothetical protein